MTTRTASLPLDLSLIYQAYETYDAPSTSTPSAMQRGRTPSGFPTKSAIDETSVKELNPQDQSLDEFDICDRVTTAYSTFPPLAVKESFRENVKAIHKIIRKYWDQLFITNLQGLTNKNTTEDQIDLCFMNITALYGICSSFLVKHNKIQIPSPPNHPMRAKKNKVDPEELKFNEKFQIALRRRNLLIRKCTLNICASARMYYKAIGEETIIREIAHLEFEGLRQYVMEEQELESLMGSI